jgi:hypothetical protein
VLNRKESDVSDYSASDYAPLPIPSDERIDAAALDVANLSRVPVMEKGWATFTRDTLVCTGWWDMRDCCDHSGANDIEVRVPPLYIDEVDREWSWKHHVRHCRLEVTQAIERFDFERAETGEDLKHAKTLRRQRRRRRASAKVGS